MRLTQGGGGDGDADAGSGGKQLSSGSIETRNSSRIEEGGDAEFGRCASARGRRRRRPWVSPGEGGGADHARGRRRR
jgi:hypothetical protein